VARVQNCAETPLKGLRSPFSRFPVWDQIIKWNRKDSKMK